MIVRLITIYLLVGVDLADQTTSNGKLVHTMTGVAGVAGCGIAALILVYRDVLSGTYLTSLSGEHSALILGLVVLTTFFVAVLAIFVWLAKHPRPEIAQRTYVFLALVVVLVGAVLFAVWRVVPPTAPAQTSNLDQGVRLFELGKLSDAQSYFIAAKSRAPNSPVPDLWLARAALRNGENSLAQKLVRGSLKLDPSYEPARIELLVVLTLLGHGRSVENLTAESKPESIGSAAWIDCADQAGLLTLPVVTLSLIYERCPPEEYSTL